MRDAKTEKPFAFEADLCAAFIAALPKGWTSYAETGGWDILLVRDDGFQVGIEAKLKFNATVLQQSLEEYAGWHADAEGPDCRAVLVPSGESSLRPLADYIGIAVIQMRGPSTGYAWGGPKFTPPLPDEAHLYSNDPWHEWCPTKRHRLPAYVPDVAAGNPSPVQLTEWKIKALKLLILAETQGFVTRADFKFLRIDHRRWISAEGWLRVTAERGRYSVHGEAPMGLRQQHSRVYDEIKADAPKWMPPDIAALPKSTAPAGRSAAEHTP